MKMKKRKTNEEIAEEISWKYVIRKGVKHYIKEGFDRKDIVEAILKAFDMKK